jgi:hypothetical protein
MPLSYDLHVHPGPSRAPRWGTGRDVWDAARAAGVRGFVWKSHESHTHDACRALASVPVRAFASASLNPWATFADITAAVLGGATWIWGPTTDAEGDVGWDLPLPADWSALSAWLLDRRPNVVLATGHLDAPGRVAMARLAREAGIPCSVTHTLLAPADHLRELAELGCVFEIDCFTYAFPPARCTLGDVADVLATLEAMGALAYLTSDGGQQSTGNPYEFTASVLRGLTERLGASTVQALAVDGPSAVVGLIDGATR